MRVCCCGESKTAPTSSTGAAEEPLLKDAENAIDVRAGPQGKIIGDRGMDNSSSIMSSMHSGKTSIIEPLDDSNLHEDLHWDKILTRADDVTDPSSLSSTLSN